MASPSRKKSTLAAAPSAGPGAMERPADTRLVLSIAGPPSDLTRGRNKGANPRSGPLAAFAQRLRLTRASLAIARNFEPIEPIPQWLTLPDLARTSMMEHRGVSNDAALPIAPRRLRSFLRRLLDRPGRYLRTFSLVGAAGILALALVLADLHSRYQSAITEAQRS